MDKEKYAGISVLNYFRPAARAGRVFHGGNYVGL